MKVVIRDFGIDSLRPTAGLFLFGIPCIRLLHQTRGCRSAGPASGRGSEHLQERERPGYEDVEALIANIDDIKQYLLKRRYAYGYKLAPISGQYQYLRHFSSVHTQAGKGYFWALGDIREIFQLAAAWEEPCVCQ